MNDVINYQCHLNHLEFSATINHIVSEYDIEEIVETGTNLGVGSTLTLAKTGLDVYTIECNPSFHSQAKNNMLSYSNVTCCLGLSLKKSDMITFLKSDKYTYPSDIVIDSLDPVGFYTQEIDFAVQDNLLPSLIENDKRQIIFLDSAGGVGYQEFLTVMRLTSVIKQHKVIVLDDCRHIKHYRSVEFLKNEGYKVNEVLNGRLVWVKL